MVKVIMPSTSDGWMPASSSAALEHSAASCSSLRPEALENSVAPMPAMAASLKVRAIGSVPLLRAGPEHRHLVVAHGGLEEHFHRHVDLHVLELDAVEVGDQAIALFQLDGGGDGRFLEAERRRVARHDPR